MEYKGQIIPDSEINGCGSKNSWKLNIKEFQTPCNIHDCDYYIGGTRKDKLKADFKLFKSCYINALNDKGLRKVILLWLSIVMFILVITFGNKYFSFKKSNIL